MKGWVNQSKCRQFKTSIKICTLHRIVKGALLKYKIKIITFNIAIKLNI